MKEDFTIKEIMESTGLTRQRVHQLIKSRDIPITKENKRILVKWLDLLNMTDNPTILGFLRRTLEGEKRQVEDAYRRLRENAKGMMYAYVLLIEKELPTAEGTDFDWIRLFRKASYYWGGYLVAVIAIGHWKPISMTIWMRKRQTRNQRASG